MLLFCYLLACLSQIESPPPQEDISALWKENPAAALAKINTKTEEEKILLIRTIIEDPTLSKNPKLCSILSDSDRIYCQKLLHRSHIWEYDIIRQNQRQKSTPNSQNGPSTSQLTPKNPIVPKPIVAAKDSPCKSQNNQQWCIQQAAVTATSKTPDNGGPLCQILPEGQPREECFFQIAEASLSNLPMAFEYCHNSQTYATHCYAHLIEGFIPTTATKWKIFEDRAAQIQQLTLSDEQFQRDLLDYYWTLAIKHLFDQGKIHFLPDDLPSNISRHTRAARAYAYIATAPVAERSLEEWVSLIQANKSTSFQKSKKNIRDIWPANRNPYEQSFTATFYLTLARRPYLEGAMDWHIVTTLALIQHRFPIQHIVSEDPIVQWLLTSSR